MTKVIGILCVFILSQIGINATHAQGLNNHYPIDETDIKNSLKMLGIEIYKFPLQSNEDSVYFNFIVEEFSDTTLLERSDNLEDIKKAVPAQYLPATLSRSLAGHDTSLVRMIMYNNPGAPFEIQIDYNGILTDCPSRFDKEKYGKPQTRGFTYSIPKINEKVPVLVIYAPKKGQQIVHCPAGFMPDQIKRKYPYTCFVYVELVKLR
jgi:hypothetical protein